MIISPGYTSKGVIVEEGTAENTGLLKVRVPEVHGPDPSKLVGSASSLFKDTVDNSELPWSRTVILPTVTTGSVVGKEVYVTFPSGNASYLLVTGFARESSPSNIIVGSTGDPVYGTYDGPVTYKEVGFGHPMYTSGVYFVRGFTSSHHGVDLSGGGDNVPIFACAGGVVEQIESHWSGGTTGTASWGNRVLILHDNGLRTHYCHLRETHVSLGERVVGTGDTNKTGLKSLGYKGTTGNSTGPHLHIEVWTNGSSTSRVNPEEYINLRFTVP